MRGIYKGVNGWERDGVDGGGGKAAAGRLKPLLGLFGQVMSLRYASCKPKHTQRA